jgi:ribosome maturation factor RimP
LDELVRQSCSEVGVELVECDLFQAGNRKILRIFIDRPTGVSIDDCAKVSRSLGALLDLEDLIPTAYNIEVSSPGLDRPLKTTRDFERNIGHLVRITKPKGAPLIGRLKAVTEETLVVAPKTKGLEQTVLRAEILLAKVEAEL